jgi:hypothetical protein
MLQPEQKLSSVYLSVDILQNLQATSGEMSICQHWLLSRGQVNCTVLLLWISQSRKWADFVNIKLHLNEIVMMNAT